MAVPLLVVIKVSCDHFESLSPAGNFLAAQHTAVVDDEPAGNNHNQAA